MIEEDLIKERKLERHQGTYNVFSREATPHPAVIFGKTDDWLMHCYFCKVIETLCCGIAGGCGWGRVEADV